MTRRLTNQRFTQLRQKLNVDQLAAVEAIEGPVMVLAGPGTGKTQVVAMRIAEILSRTQISARNVLALTFTEAGVTALRSRLETIIGPDAYQVTIGTFHAFAGDIISTFPYLFNFDETAHQLGDLDRYLLLEKIVTTLPHLTALRPVKQPTSHIVSIGQAIRSLKQEAVSPDELRKLVAEHRAVLTADQKLTATERARQLLYINRNQELADIYAAYQTNLEATQRYDYEDMILRVVDALQKSEELRLHYQERYQYILVDEYQDTNNGQNALVEALASFFADPNIFVVGDDKQAIYRFQGASVANMLHFIKKYPTMKTFSLKQNYRSSPEIVATAAELISHNRHQLAVYLPTIAGVVTAVRPSGPPPELVVAPTSGSQFDWLIREIKGLKTIPLPEIAVLFRTNADSREFRALAEKAGLRVGGSLQSNLVREPEVQALVTMLRAIDNPRHPVVLLPALRSLVDPPALGDLLAAQEQTKKPLLDWLINNPNSRLRTAATTVLSLHQQALKVSLTELVELIVRETDLLERARARPDRLEGLELITAFLEEMRRFSTRRPRAGLRDFLDYLELLGVYNIQLSVNRVLPERDGLFIGTVHAAKGLEFRAVFLPNIDEHSWNTRASRSVITLPGSIVDQSDWVDDAAEDDRRLLYVGLTRAKERLYLSYAATDSNGRPALPCQFVAEIKATMVEKTIAPTSQQTEAFYRTALSPTPEAAIAARELAFICEQVRTKPFSFTDLKTYQLCPKQYLLRSVFRLPSEPTIPLVYGTAVHHALELFFRAYKAKQTLPSLRQLQKFFRQALGEQPAVARMTALAEQGERIITAYYQLRSPSWPVPVGVEYSFRPHQVMLEDIWISGKFDRLDPLDPVARTVRVVDYKTVSRPKSRNEIQGLTKTSDGSLKKQLVFYAMLASRDRLFPYRATEFVLSFIDDKALFHEESFAISREEIAALEQEVTTTFREILARTNFPHTREIFDRGCEICAAFPSL